MYNDLKELYSEYFNRDIDQKLVDDIKMFRLNWAQKEEAYIEFLGGTTLGAQALRFSIKDDEGLIVDTLNMDISSLTYSLTNVKGITKGRAAETNTIYQTLVYLMHRFMTSKLPMKVKEEAIKECYYIFAYKKFSSLMFHYFKYPAPEAVTKAVYEKLNNKFLIKKYNNWQEVFEYRAEDVTPGGIHHKRLTDYNVDDAIRVIVDLQSKLSDMFKNIYAVTVEVTNSNERIVTDNLFETIEGEETLKSITNTPDRYAKYIRSIIRSQTDFVKYDLAHLVASQFNKMISNQLYTFLLEVCNMDQKHIDTLIDVAIIESLEVLRAKGITKEYGRNIAEVMSVIKNKYINLRYDSKRTKEIKKHLEKSFIKVFPKARYISLQIAIAVIVYTFVRCFYKD